MYQTKKVSRVAASVLAMGLIGGLASTAQAQSIQCQYWTGQSDPLLLRTAVTEPFTIDVVAVQENPNQTELQRVTGRASATFNATPMEDDDSIEEVEGPITINEGSFEAEVDANLQATEDEPNLTCAQSAKIRGVGLLNFDAEDQDDVTAVIRHASRLDGAPRAGTIADCDFNEESCSVHKVNARLRITAEGERDNGSANYQRSTLNRNAIFEAYEGAPPLQGQELVLLCGCLATVDNTNGDDTNGDNTNGDNNNGDDTNGADNNGDDSNGDEDNGDNTAS